MKISEDKLAKIIATKVTDQNLHEVAQFIYLELSKRKRLGSLDRFMFEVKRIRLLDQNKILAEVTSAKALENDEMDLLATQLEQKFSRKVEIVNRIKPSILGGVKIKVEDEVIDFSWRGKLNQIKQRLVGSYE